MLENLKSLSKILTYVLAGGVLFWTPDIALEAHRGYTSSRWDMLLIALLMPGTLLSGYAILFRLRGKDLNATSLAFFMLIGIWLLGSLAMMIGASFSGGGFSLPGADVWAVVVLGLLPPYTFIMLAYDGSLLAFMIGAMAMIMMHIAFERRQWILPGKVMRWLRLSET